MKPMFLFLRIMIVGILWSIFFIEGIRVIMLTNWHFDILRSSHWIHAWNLWISGWVIDEAKEWAFILIVFSMIPVWITVWAALSVIKWEALIKNAISSVLSVFGKLFEKQVKQYKNSASLKVVKKKKSYKEIRPKSAGTPLEESPSKPISIFDEDRRAALSGAPVRSKTKPTPLTQPAIKTSEPKEFSHSLFTMDDEEPLDFDLFEDDSSSVQKNLSEEKESEKYEEKSRSAKKADKRNSTPNTNNRKTASENSQKNKTKPSMGNSTFELLKQKGYDIISGATIKNTFIDFIGVSKSQICLCINDKEPGDWLADEERFNDEEPLWFSESSHRISPVRKVDLARITLNEKLKDVDLSFEVVPFVIEQIGNIINAEDMLDIWKDLDIKVTRIDRGTPKEIPLFAKTLEDADENVDKNVLEKLKKLIRSIA